MRRIKLRHLQAFVETARRKSITRAAQSLFVTHAAVSKTLSELENMLGAKLLERDGGKITLTQCGEIFIRHARQGLAAVSIGAEEVALVKEQGGFQIAFGALPNVSARIVPLSVGEFMRDNPLVLTRVITGFNSGLLARLRAGELEFVIGRLLARAGDMEGLSFEHLYSERLALVAAPGHPILKKGRRKDADDVLRDVAKYILVSLPPETSVRDAMDRLFMQVAGALPPRRVETNSSAIARGMVLNGGALWCAPLEVVETDVAAGILCEVPADMSGTPGAVGMSVRAGFRPSPQCAALMDKIRAAAGSIKGAKSYSGRTKNHRRVS